MALLVVVLLQAVLPSFADGEVDDFARATIASQILPSNDINSGFAKLKGTFYAEAVRLKRDKEHATLLEGQAKASQKDKAAELEQLKQQLGKAEGEEAQLIDQLNAKEEAAGEEYEAKEAEIEKRREEALLQLSIKGEEARQARDAYGQATSKSHADESSYNSIKAQKDEELAHLTGQIAAGKQAVQAQETELEIAQQELQQLMLARQAQAKVRNASNKELDDFERMLAQAIATKEATHAAKLKAEEAFKKAQAEYDKNPPAAQTALALEEQGRQEQQAARSNVASINAVMQQADAWRESADQFYAKLTEAEASLTEITKKGGVKLFGKTGLTKAWSPDKRAGSWQKIAAQQQAASELVTDLLDALKGLNLKSNIVAGTIVEAGIMKKGELFDVNTFHINKDKVVLDALKPHCGVYFAAKGEEHEVCR